MADRYSMVVANSAGVSQMRRQPFGGLEINDQVGGVNGVVTDDVATSGSLVSKNKMPYKAGILGREQSRTFSTAYAN